MAPLSSATSAMKFSGKKTKGWVSWAKVFHCRRLFFSVKLWHSRRANVELSCAFEGSKKDFVESRCEMTSTGFLFAKACRFCFTGTRRRSGCSIQENRKFSHYLIDWHPSAFASSTVDDFKHWISRIEKSSYECIERFSHEICCR